MSLRIVMYVGRFPRIFYIKPETKWFTYKKGSYRVDPEAICQVLNKGDRIKGTVELLYNEGYPLPLRSKLDPRKVTLEHAQEIRSTVFNQPKKGFFDLILRRN